MAGSGSATAGGGRAPPPRPQRSGCSRRLPPAVRGGLVLLLALQLAAPAAAGPYYSKLWGINGEKWSPAGTGG